MIPFLLGAITAAVVLGYFLHDMTCQRDTTIAVLALANDAMRNDARRIHDLCDDNARLTRAMTAATEDLAIAADDLAWARLTIAVQGATSGVAAPPPERTPPDARI